jgi:hypothetical protein
MVEDVKKEFQLQLNNPETQKIAKAIITATDYDKRIFDIATHFPPMDISMKVIIAILNLVLPGIGTIVMSTRYKKCSKTQLIIGLMQLMMAFEIVGYLWSLIWVVLICIKMPGQPEESKKLNDTSKEEVYNMSQMQPKETGPKINP